MINENFVEWIYYIFSSKNFLKKYDWKNVFIFIFFLIEDFSIKNYILKKFTFSEKLLIVLIAIIIIVLHNR